MTTTREPSTTTPTIPNVEAPLRRRGQKGWFAQLLLRLHFYAGIFVGPFILLAALSGAAYAAAPSIDRVVYHHELTTPSRGAELPLATQIASAQHYIASRHPHDTLLGLKTAAKVGQTTQVMFSEKGLLDGQVRSVWIDPVTGVARGDLKVFSTALPISTWVDFFHRTLFLGDVGRLYSELAASWLGIISLAGLGLCIIRIRKTRRKREMLAPQTRATGYRSTFSWHSATGIWLLIGALFLSATGITWSLHAGTNVREIRAAFSWSTPSLTTAVPASTASSADGSAQRHGQDLQLFDEVLAKAQSVNIHVPEVEIDLPTEPGQAWTVEEIRRSYPTAVSSVAIDPTSLSVVSRADWDKFPLAAKLTEWGIDTHMGLMFGLPNQIALFILGIGIAAMVVFGYIMWWQRRPTRGRARFGKTPAAGALTRAPWWGLGAVMLASLGIGILLPELGATLLAFVIVDTLLTSRAPREGGPHPLDAMPLEKRRA